MNGAFGGTPSASRRHALCRADILPVRTSTIADKWNCPWAAAVPPIVLSSLSRACIEVLERSALRLASSCSQAGLGSRSVGESARLIPHSGRDYGPGTQRRLELRRSREIEAQHGLWQGHGTTSTGSIASADNSVRGGIPEPTRRVGRLVIRSVRALGTQEQSPPALLLSGQRPTGRVLVFSI